MREAHAIVRARERYGLDLTDGQLESLAELIQQNHGRLIGWLDKGRTAWKLKFKDTWVRIVMDKSLYEVVTFLPPSGPVVVRDGLHPLRPMRKRLR